MPLVEDAQRAARTLRERAYVRILARQDGDAVCATALLAHALRREGIDFHATWVPRLAPQPAEDESDDALVLVGLGGDAAPARARIAIDRAGDDAAADARVTGDASLGAL